MGWGGREVGLCTERKSIEGENFYGVLKCVMNGRFLRRSMCRAKTYFSTAGNVRIGLVAQIMSSMTILLRIQKLWHSYRSVLLGWKSSRFIF